MLTLNKLITAGFATFVAVELYPQPVYSHRCDVCHTKKIHFRFNLVDIFRKRIKKNFQRCIKKTHLKKYNIELFEKNQTLKNMKKF